MAEIKIEKKAPIWPWILLAVIILGLLIYFLTRDKNGDTVATGTDTTGTYVDTSRGTTGQGVGTGAIAQYTDYINSNRSMGLQHEYTNGALLRLANAIEAKANQVDYNIEGDMSRVREIADEITRDPLSTDHANKISNAANILAGVMSNIQQAKFPQLNKTAQEVKQAANSIKPGTLTLEQKDEVNSFFDKSSELLQNMN